MRLMLAYMKPYKGKVTLTVFLKFAAVILELLIPYMLEYMIDEAAPKKQIIHVIVAGLVMVMLADIILDGGSYSKTEFNKIIDLIKKYVDFI